MLLRLLLLSQTQIYSCWMIESLLGIYMSSHRSVIHFVSQSSSSSRLSTSLMDPSSSSMSTSSKTSKPGTKRTTTHTPPTKRLCSEISSTVDTGNTIFGFSPFIVDFHGYMCQFLTKETQFIVKFYSPKLLFTKTESLVVFEMADNFRNICEGSVGPILNQFATPDCQVVNPFTTTHTKPLFIRLSSKCAYYRKIGTEPA